MPDIKNTLLQKKLKPFLDRGMNRDIFDVNETLKLFFELYFEWLDETGNAAERLSGIQKYREIDSTSIDEFFTHFREEYLKDFDTNVLIDKQQLVKHIKQFYNMKGSEKAFRFIFRLLYNEEIEIYYPKDDVLRTSDGKWIVEQIIKTTANTQNGWGHIIGKMITGVDSGATGLVENAIRLNEGGEDVTELSLSSVDGTFIVGENIEALLESGLYIRERIFECVSSLVITDGGSGYQVGDKYPIRIDDSSNEIVGYARIDRLSPSSISGLNILDGGIGYRGAFRQVETYVGLSCSDVIDGVPLENTVIGSTNSYGHRYEDIPVNTLLPIPLNIPDTADTIVFSDVPSSLGNGASAVVDLVSETGEIISVTLLNGGKNYEQPSAVVRSINGAGAVLEVVGANTGMDKISPVDFPHHPTGVDLYVDVPTGSVDIVYGQLITKEGYWKNTDGQLDSDKRLQDSYYYQDFSYDVRTSRAIADYESFVKESLHPAGYKMFGTVLCRGYGVVPVLFADIAISFYPAIEAFGAMDVEPANAEILLTWADEFAIRWNETTIGRWGTYEISYFLGKTIDHVINGVSPYSGCSPGLVDFNMDIVI